MKLQRLLILALMLIGSATGFAEEKKIALTFNEVPFMKPLGFWRPREVSNQLLRTLEQEEIVAAGFVVQEKAEDDPAGYIILDDWLSRGHILGNQTWGDIDYNEVGYDDFMEHAIDGQKYLKKLFRIHEINFRYMRFPQLHEGNDPKKKKKVRKALERANYQIAHVTVKTSDFAFNPAYVEHSTDPASIARLRQLYLDHVMQSLNYAESQSKRVFGRNISHILQLHAGIATVMFLPDLIEALRGRGYTFVSLPEALKDKAFQEEEDYVGPLGLSFIDRVAATRGLPFDETAGELGRADVENALSPRRGEP